MILGDIEEYLQGKSKAVYIFIGAAASLSFWELNTSRVYY
jgi:hypothetical protein